MPISLNGSTNVITGVAVGGLPDGIVDTDMLAANAVSSAKLASGVGGKILQIKSANMSTDFSMASGNETDITGLSVDITKTSASNKILVVAVLTPYMGGTGGNGQYRIKCYRDSTTIHNNTFGFMRESSTHKSAGPVLVLLENGANDTSSHTYKMTVKGEQTGQTFYIFTYSGANINSLTLMEVAV